tara:strand:+ start:2251 stop:2571 length:321 start_codon:yes stop_codon:yes gene_type:complete
MQKQNTQFQPDVSFNIPAEIQAYAASKGLTCLATGGGCDFIVHVDYDGHIAVLMTDFGETPCWVDDISNVVLFGDKDDWSTELANVEFRSATEAMDYMYRWSKGEV